MDSAFQRNRPVARTRKNILSSARRLSCPQLFDWCHAITVCEQTVVILILATDSRRIMSVSIVFTRQLCNKSPLLYRRYRGDTQRRLIRFFYAAFVAEKCLEISRCRRLSSKTTVTTLLPDRHLQSASHRSVVQQIKMTSLNRPDDCSSSGGGGIRAGPQDQQFLLPPGGDTIRTPDGAALIGVSGLDQTAHCSYCQVRSTENGKDGKRSVWRHRSRGFMARGGCQQAEVIHATIKTCNPLK